MREKIDYSSVDDLGNEWVVYADDHLRICGLQEDPESEEENGKTSYEYYFDADAANKLEEYLIKEFGEERSIEDILDNEFDYCYGLGTLHFYCERRKIPHTFEW